MDGEDVITYKYLMKRAFKYTIEITVIFILIFFWEEIFNLIRVLYRF